MSIHPPPYLLEYRAARAIMAKGNIGPATLVDLLDKGDAFFFDGDKSNFEKCALCKPLLQTHKSCFLKPQGDDLAVQSAVAAKLIEKGKLEPVRCPLAQSTLRMIGIAARRDLTCVVQPDTILWDNMAAYKAAQVSTVELSDFIRSF